MTKRRPDQTACAWCGGGIHQPLVGRRRQYCRAAHRQRAYEARRMGWRIGLDSGEALVSAAALADLGDRLTILEAALEDVQRDLRSSRGDEDYRAAFRHLYAAAGGLRGRRLRARALVRPE